MFKSGLEHFIAAGRSLKEFIKEVLARYGNRIVPYLRRFQQEIKAGTVKIKGLTKAEKRVQKQDKPSEGQVVYKPASKGFSLGTLIPVNMQTAVSDALGGLIKKHGDINAYVANELGYPVEKLTDYFVAEQIDAIALSLSNMAKDAGFIIGDQTGTGKGRVVASMIRYAIKNGKTPIFVTEKPNLYSDMYRDLTDIGMPDLNILMTNAGTKMEMDESGEKILKTKSSRSHNALLQSLMDEGSLGDFDVIFTTYSQMQPVKGARTVRMDFLSAFAAGGLAIFDESHNAGGTGTGKRGKEKLSRGGFARELISIADGVMYSSATYAKRPDVMDLYSKTDMHMAVDNIANLPEAINAGGVPLQQVNASMLVESGQYIRRERTFEGVEYDPKVVPVDRKMGDQISAVMAEIQNFSKHREKSVKLLAKEAKKEAKAVTGQSGTADATSINFTSVMHNLIDQMLLSLKVAPAVDDALAALERGEKPVLTVANTMGSFIEEYVKEIGLIPGDAIDISFGSLLERYLERTRTVTEKDAFGNKEKIYLTDDQLTSKALQSYKTAQSLISGLGMDDIPVSPIDYIKSKLEEKGYKVGEITGRQHIIEYRQDGTDVYNRRPAKDIKPVGRKRTISAFNSGGIDAMILNQAGSTGLSLHASEKFKDQSMRHMIIVQPEKNIDTHMQMLGRVHRTGQIKTPRYTQMIANIPAEKRPAAVLAKKMASLNANTTASRKSALTAKDTPDFMNEFGDYAVASVMADMPELNFKLGEPLKTKDDGYDSEDAARKVTGRIPLLPVEEQEEVYSLIESEYKEVLANEEAMGSGGLEAKTLDLDAKTKDTVEVHKGKGGTSPFAAGAQAEIMDIKRIGKPYTSKQVISLLGNSVGIVDATDLREVQIEGKKQTQEMLSGLRSDFAAYKIDAIDSIEDEKKRKAQETRLDGQLNKVSRIMNTVPIGAMVQIQSEQEDFYGTVLNIDRKGKAKNPAALGTWKVTLGIADAKRHIIFPMTKIDVSESSVGVVRITPRDFTTNLYENMPVIDLYDHGQSESREQRVIITGNLLAGYSKFSKGQIINFTDHNNRMRQGILMPKNFNLDEEMEKQPVEFGSGHEVAKFLQMVHSGMVMTEDKLLQIVSIGRADYYSISVPASKAKGGQYFLNEAILNAAGRDFVSVGGVMRIQISGAGMSRIADAIIGKTDHGLMAFDHRGQARAATNYGDKTPARNSIVSLSDQVFIQSAQDEIGGYQGGLTETINSIRVKGLNKKFNSKIRSTSSGATQRLKPTGVHREIIAGAIHDLLQGGLPQSSYDKIKNIHIETDSKQTKATYYAETGEISIDMDLLADIDKWNYSAVVAWHGTPHEVDQFSSEKIGTGEGAQAYGYGLYFAGNKAVAEWYRTKLGGHIDVYYEGEKIPYGRTSNPRNYLLQETASIMRDPLVMNAISEGDATFVETLTKTLKYDRQNGRYDKDFVNKAIELIDSVELYKVENRFPGNLYQVGLAPSEDEYLLWDKPLSEQSEKVRAALKNASFIRAYKGAGGWVEAKGSGIYGGLAGANGGKQAASEYLHSLGIRGIKFLDGSSRRKGKGDYNYVVFSDEDINISDKPVEGLDKSAIDNPELEIRLITLRLAIAHELGHSIDVDEFNISAAAESEAFKLVYTPPLGYQDATYNAANDTEFGDIIDEAYKAYTNNSGGLIDYLKYPFDAFQEKIMLGGEEGRIWLQEESFAQLHSLYYVYPELMRQHLPQAYRLFERIHNELHSTTGSAVNATVQATVRSLGSIEGTKDNKQRGIARPRRAIFGDRKGRGSVDERAEAGGQREAVDVPFSDPETETRFQEARKGIGGKGSLLTRFDEWVKHTVYGFTRHYVHLEKKSGFYAEAYEALRQYEHAPTASKEEATHELEDIVGNLNQDEMVLFTRKVVLDDLVWESEQNHDLPFGMTAESIEIDLALIDDAVSGSPNVQAALLKRSKLHYRMKHDLVDAGILTKKQVENPNYFRHQVLAFAQLERDAKQLFSGKKLKKPKPGYAKKRKGSLLDINANYIEAEFEYLSRALTDLKAVKALQKIQRNYDIKDDLKVRARDMNESGVNSVISRERDSLGITGEDLSPTEAVLKGFAQKIAIGHSIVSKEVESNPEDYPAKYKEIVDAIVSGQDTRELGGYMSFLRRIIKDNLPGAAGANMVLDGGRRRMEFKKKLLADNWVTWRDIIPEGYRGHGIEPPWQPDKGNIFFSAKTMPHVAVDRLVELLAENPPELISRKELEMAMHRIREGVMVGGRKLEFAIPEELALTLDNIGPKKEETITAHFFATPMRSWKIWTLINPRAWFKYNMNNASGDLDGVIAGNPRVVKKLPKAIKEIFRVIYKGQKPSESYKDAVERGVFDSGISLNEIPDINTLSRFQHLLDKSEKKRWHKNAIFKAWRFLRESTIFRENWARYAAYLDYVERLDSGESMDSIGYGATYPKMVDGLSSNKDKAAILSRDLVGDYGAISQHGQDVRDKMIAFYSWMEVNLKRYYRLNANAFHQGIGKGFKTVGTLGAIKGARLSAHMYARMLFLTAMVHAWNHLMFPDEEEELEKMDRMKMHINLGRDSEGKVILLRFEGALSDFLSWFGWEDAVAAINEVERGRATYGDVAAAVATAPINKVLSGLTPVIKVPAELMSELSFFPDIWEPRAVHDRWRHLAQTFNLQHEYDWLTGQPMEDGSYAKTLSKAAVRKIDLEEQAYYQSRDLVRDFMEREVGREGYSMISTEKSRAVAQWKRAKKKNDKDAVKAAENKMKEVGVSPRSVFRVKKSGNPVESVPRNLRMKFMGSLNADERKTLNKGIKWWNSNF